VKRAGHVMPDDSNPLTYRSKGDAIAEDVEAMRRSFGTWVVLCAVWVVGLVVWAGYLALVAFLIFRVIL
jgi:hypothetical protein